MANLRAKMGNTKTVLTVGAHTANSLDFVREHVVANRFCMLMTACAALAVASRVWALRLLWLWAHCLSDLCGVRVMSRGEDGHLARAATCELGGWPRAQWAPLH